MRRRRSRRRLGSRNRVSMPELRNLLTELGYGEVRTLLQSGNINVIARDPFGAEADDPRRYQVTFLAEEPSPDAARTGPRLPAGTARNWSTVTALLEPADE
jgi:uncharacterized protein (DUF1697 family)